MKDEKIKVTRIEAETKQDAVEQAFKVMKDELEIEGDFTLKDLMYDSFIKSMPCEAILKVTRSELYLKKLNKLNEDKSGKSDDEIMRLILGALGNGR